MKKMAITICIILLYLNGYSQNWPIHVRSGIFLLLAQGGTPNADPGTFTRKDSVSKGDLWYNLYFHFAVFSDDSLMEHIATRYYSFISSFILKDSLQDYNSVYVNFYAMPLGYLKKTWNRPVPASLTNDQEPIDRLNLLLAVLPFHVTGHNAKDSIVVELQDIKPVTPIFHERKTYSEILATVIHYYVMQGIKKKVKIIYGDGVNTNESFVFNRHTHYEKMLHFSNEPMPIFTH